MWDFHQDEMKHQLELAQHRETNLQQQFEACGQQIDELIAERDRYKEAYVELSLECRENRGTPAPEQPHRSVKLPDPPILTDGKDPKFDDWLFRMRSKLNANADHYSNELFRIAYVQNRIGGRAAKHTAPRFREGSLNTYQNAEEIFQHLKSIFFDPSQRMAARHQLRNLQMKPYQKFHDFLATPSHSAYHSVSEQ